MNTMHTLALALLFVSASVAAWAGPPAPDDVAKNLIGYAEDAGHDSLDDGASTGHGVLATGAEAGRAAADEAFATADGAGREAKTVVDAGQELADEASARTDQLAADVKQRAGEEADWLGKTVMDRAPAVDAGCGSTPLEAGDCLAMY